MEITAVKTYKCSALRMKPQTAYNLSTCFCSLRPFSGNLH